MTQATHTPGPWELTFGEYDAAIHAGATIAMVDDTMRAWKENARLIAAAPDMLAALESLLEGTCEALSFLDRETVKHLKPLIDTAEATIAKAKGE